MRQVGLLLFVAAIVVPGCRHDPLAVNTSGVDLQIGYARFDRAFFGTPGAGIASQLPLIRREFPEFFLTEQTDEEWLAVHRDPYLQMLQEKVAIQFPDLSALRPDVEAALEHFRYYYPASSSRVRVITYISGLDWEYPVIAADSVYFIGLDLFLGADTVYDQFPRYIASRFDPAYLGPKLARILAEPLVVIDRSSGSFLSQILYEGRVLYLMEAFLPQAEKYRLMEYTRDQYNWCVQHEEEVWTYFVEEELLFSDDNELYGRFIAEAPFSKFYKKVDRESPGRVGRWIGWQIVRAYMEAHPGTSVQELARLSNAQELFRNAQYKPFR